MAFVDSDMPLIPLSSLSEVLNVKVRTLKMYEEKGLLPKKDNSVKKLYSYNDVKKIAFVHYLASVKRINAHGIKFINELIGEYVDGKQAERLFNTMETSLEETPQKDIVEVENF